MKKQNLFQKLKNSISSIGWKLFIWGLGITQEEYWERIYLQEKIYKRESNSEYSQQEIEQLQSKIHKITGDGEIMGLFNELLGNNAGS
jgi:hypothetical protein